jgi:DNA polymerase III subunit delta
MSDTIDVILKNIKRDSLLPVYLLHGDEPYFIEKIAKKIQDVAIPAHDKGFNEFVLIGKELSVGSLLNYARRFPMMAERQLILVKDANQIQGLEDKTQTAMLEDFALKPLSSTILVLCFNGSADERKAWVKSFGKKGMLFQSKKMYDNQIPEFIANYCHSSGVKISMKAIQMVNEFVGGDLKRICGELDKIFINLGIGESIEAATVEKFVGISKEYNVFELQKALGMKDILKTNQIINQLSRNPKDNPLPPIVINLYNYFCKILIVNCLNDKSEINVANALGTKPFFVKEYLAAARKYTIHECKKAIEAIKEIDLKSKGVEASGGEENYLKEMAFKILN